MKINKLYSKDDFKKLGISPSKYHSQQESGQIVAVIIILCVVILAIASMYIHVFNQLQIMGVIK